MIIYLYMLSDVFIILIIIFNEIDLAKFIQLNKSKYEIIQSTFYDYNRKIFPYKEKISFVFCYDIKQFCCIKVAEKSIYIIKILLQMWLFNKGNLISVRCSNFS